MHWPPVRPTGSFEIEPVQLTADPVLIGCWLGGCDPDEVRRHLETERRHRRDVSLYVVGSAVKNNAASMVIAVLVDDDDRSAVAEIFRNWQAEGVDPRNQAPITGLFGPPAVSDGQFGAPVVSDGGTVVVATFPVVAKPPRTSRLWLDMLAARSLPFVTID